MHFPKEVAAVKKTANIFHPQQAVLTTSKAILRLANCRASNIGVFASCINLEITSLKLVINLF